jgi:hypothetical protein
LWILQVNKANHDKLQTNAQEHYLLDLKNSVMKMSNLPSLTNYSPQKFGKAYHRLLAQYPRGERNAWKKPEFCRVKLEEWKYSNLTCKITTSFCRVFKRI